MNDVELILKLCTQQGWTIATAESVTAGGIAVALAREPGCSAVLRGSVVAYDPWIKVHVLGVDASDINHIVSAPVAQQMATGVAARLEASIGIATTGVAGLDPIQGEPSGTVWCAIVSPRGSVNAMSWQLQGTRTQIQDEAVRRAVQWLAMSVQEWSRAGQ